MKHFYHTLFQILKIIHPLAVAKAILLVSKNIIIIIFIIKLIYISIR